jgi:DNA-binding response OmpR family regulator
MIGLDIGQQLADAGYEAVGPATSVEKALRFIAEPGCDVAILDVNLGGKTSEPVARKLRGSGKPFVVFSGYSTDDVLPWFKGTTVLSKPFRVADLLTALRQCVEAGSKGRPSRAGSGTGPRRSRLKGPCIRVVIGYIWLRQIDIS